MKKSAFTLVEFSIALIIIGILIAGIMQGGGLVKSARLINARSITSKSPVASIDGLIGWYETSLKSSFKSSEAIDGAQLTEWYDVAPGAIVLKKNKMTKTAGVGVKYFEGGINKAPSVQFNGSDKFTLTSLYQGTSAQATIFLVFQPLSNPSSTLQTLFDSYSSGPTNSIGIKSAAVNLNAGSSVDTGTTNPASFSLGTSYIGAFYFNRTASATYVNDAKNLIGNAVLSPGTNQLSGLTIGTNKSGSSGFTGLISEIIIYNRPLKLQERKDVMSYLSKKYKITVQNI